MSVASPEQYLANLNPAQREAVLHTEGPLLVIAGAGSGKTRVMTERTAHLIEQGIAHPGQILSITFTNKAAGEMRQRLARRVGPELAAAVTLGTFHALCARILRAHPGDSGRSARYSIYDEGDSKRVLERYLTRADKARIERDEVLAAISRAKNHLVARERFATATPDELGGLVLHDDIKQIVASVWAQVDTELERSDALDFDDLIAFTVALLERHSDVLASYRAEASSDHPEPSMARASEEHGDFAVSVMAAMLGGERARFVLNLPNEGQVEDLPRMAIVETPAWVQGRIVEPVPQGALPPEVSGMVRQVAAHAELTAEAAVTGNRALAVEALALHPLIRSIGAAESLVDAYLHAHADLLPQFPIT